MFFIFQIIIYNLQFTLCAILLNNLINIFFVFLPAAADYYDAFSTAELVGDDIESFPSVLGL